LGIVDPNFLIFGFFRIDVLRMSGLYFSPLLLGSLLIVAYNYQIFCSSKSLLNILYTLIILLAIVLTGNRSTFGLAMISTLFMFLYSFFYKGVVIPKSVYTYIIFFLLLTAIISISVTNYYEAIYTTLERAANVFFVLLGIQHDDSLQGRFDNNAPNMDLIFSDIFSLFFGAGYSLGATDSDLITFMLNYGLLFTIIFYGLLIASVFVLGASVLNKKENIGFKVFIIITIIEKFVEGVFVGGVLAPGTGTYVFAFLAFALRIDSFKKQEVTYKNEVNV
jgi:hypothetical protein